MDTATDTNRPAPKRVARYTASTYYSALVNFGGEVINILRSEGGPERCIQMYMAGLKTIAAE